MLQTISNLKDRLTVYVLSVVSVSLFFRLTIPVSGLTWKTSLDAGLPINVYVMPS